MEYQSSCISQRSRNLDYYLRLSSRPSPLINLSLDTQARSTLKGILTPHTPVNGTVPKQDREPRTSRNAKKAKKDQGIERKLL
jgi:hypothetical protein